VGAKPLKGGKRVFGGWGEREGKGRGGRVMSDDDLCTYIHTYMLESNYEGMGVNLGCMTDYAPNPLVQCP